MTKAETDKELEVLKVQLIRDTSNYLLEMSNSSITDPVKVNMLVDVHGTITGTRAEIFNINNEAKYLLEIRRMGDELIKIEAKRDKVTVVYYVNKLADLDNLFTEGSCVPYSSIDDTFKN